MNLTDPKTSKTSQRQRKFVNQMRGMGDVPWPARRFRTAPTFSNVVGSMPNQLVGSCKRPVGTVKVPRGRLGRLRRKQDVEVRCGGSVYLRRGSLGKRRLVCVDCQARKRASDKSLRMARQLQSRFGATPHATEQPSKFRRFLRKGR